MKKSVMIVISAVTILSAANVDVSKKSLLEAYEVGHFNGVNQIEREFYLQGVEQKDIHFKRYIVAMDISEIPKAKVLLFKNYAYTEGLIPITTTNNLLVFGSYDRKADAVFLKNSILQKYYFKDRYNCKVIDNSSNKTYKKAPFIYANLFKEMMEQIKSKVKGKVFIPAEYIPIIKKDESLTSKEPVHKIHKQEVTTHKVEKKTHKVEKKSKSKTLTKYFRPKYKIEAFKYINPFPSYKAKTWADSLFKHSAILRKSKKYPFQNTITTLRGHKYIKVLNKNLFVDVEDVEIID